MQQARAVCRLVAGDRRVARLGLLAFQVVANALDQQLAVQADDVFGVGTVRPGAQRGASRQVGHVPWLPISRR
ncbi:hypothetical protein D3C80_1672910 [compost metagenome]